MRKSDNLNDPLIEGGEASVIFNLKRENHRKPLSVRMKVSGKAKQASWWLIVGNP